MAHRTDRVLCPRSDAHGGGNEAVNTIPPTISSSTALRDALNHALAWLGEVVEDVTGIISKQVLRRCRGAVQLDVRFRSSTYSRRAVPLVYSSGDCPPDVVRYGDEAGYRHHEPQPQGHHARSSSKE